MHIIQYILLYYSINTYAECVLHLIPTLAIIVDIYRLDVEEAKFSISTPNKELQLFVVDVNAGLSIITVRLYTDKHITGMLYYIATIKVAIICIIY